MNTKLLVLSALALFSTSSLVAQVSNVIRGKVVDENNKPLSAITITVGKQSVKSKADGTFEIATRKEGAITLRISSIGYRPIIVNKIINKEDLDLENILLISNDNELDEVEVFGARKRQPKGLESITRMPLKPSDQIQSISIISSKLISEQGALTITDAVRNVPGVTLFGSYGGVRESMSTRGFRGIPVLKNGVRMDSQFQTAAGVADMQGVESIQVIKGSAAITQGVITDIGNAGGVINLATKTPDFIDAGEVQVRAGSWGHFRPTFDFQTVLNDENTVAIRLNGAYERNDSYRKIVNSNRVYINPSLTWKPNDKTTIILEGDYLNDNRTPMTSAVNLAGIDTEALWLIPYDKFLGFRDDKNNTEMSSFMARFERKLSENFKLRAAFARSSFQVDNQVTSATAVRNSNYEQFNRSVSRSLRDDKNTTFQLDLVGQDVKTGGITHTMQVGVDYRIADATTTALGRWVGVADSSTGVVRNTFTSSFPIDVIRLEDNFTNDMPTNLAFEKNNPVNAYYNTFGVLAQDVITFNSYLKAILGLRYSQITNIVKASSSSSVGSAWNPSLGIMVSPIKQVNLFGSYTTSTSLRSEANLMNNGERIGPSTTNQYEFGIKSDWLDDKLRFNFTYFHINTGNLSNAEYVEGTNNPTGYYFKAGDLKRNGVEVELNGRILENLQVMLGYAYLNARYENSPSYVNGSAPMNAPKHTGNAWIQYKFNQYALNGLSLAFGAYYVGDRPVNEHSLNPDGHGSPVGTKPFDMPAYLTLNAQVGYEYQKVTTRVYINNIANEIGFNSYFRGGFINQTDPRNVSVAVSYKF